MSELEKSIEDAIIAKIITLHADFDADNVKANRAATNPGAYVPVGDDEVLVAYFSDTLGIQMQDNRALKPERWKFVVAYYYRAVPEDSQTIYIKKNLIKNALYAFNAVAGVQLTNTPFVRVEIMSESRLPYNIEHPEIDVFVWQLQTNQLFKMS